MTVEEWQNKRQACLDSAGANCAFQPGMLARETLPASYPVGDQLPIEHIIVIMHENRSFDHYLSDLKNGADVASPTATNPDADGTPVQRFHQTASCFADTNHDWAPVHAEIDDGQMDGFVTQNDPDGTRAMGYYTHEDLPFLYGLAETFAMSDRHFCSAPGATYPNRLFFLAGTSFGLTYNSLPPPNDPAGKPYENLILELNAGKVDWYSYAQDVPMALLLLTTYTTNVSHFLPVTPCSGTTCRNFMDDARNGNLPQFAFLESSDGSSAYPSPPDEHPPGDPQVGQQWLQTVLDAIMQSPDWPKTAVFLTYDEHGGLYDHVPPPAAVPPDELAPATGPTAFNMYGPRVPLILISPYAKRGHVSHNVSDHTSITRFVEARFNLPAMTRRDANADPLYDLFDFDHPNTDVPSLPTVTIDQPVLNACISQFPNASTF
jgi:phospholipase C